MVIVEEEAERSSLTDLLYLVSNSFFHITLITVVLFLCRRLPSKLAVMQLLSMLP